MSDAGESLNCPHCGASFAKPPAAQLVVECDACGEAIRMDKLLGGEQWRNGVIGAVAEAHGEAQRQGRKVALIVAAVFALLMGAAVLYTIGPHL
jgi:ribosomal protein S27E